MNKLLYIIYSIGIISFVLVGCKGEPQKLPTKGYVKCFVDESLYNVVKESAETFTRLYPRTRIDIVSVMAREGIAKVLNNEAELFISSRALNNEEEQFIIKQKLGVRIAKYCYDGIAVISNKNNSLNEIDFAMIQKSLSGKNKIQAIIPGKNSGVFEYLSSQVLTDKRPINCKIVSSEVEVINDVEKSRGNVIGLVGFNMLKDKTGLKILAVSSDQFSQNGKTYYPPHPGYFVNNEYPLTRTTIIMINEIGLGVASGFASYLTSTDGQKIVLKNNLGPATVPVKLNQTLQ